MLVIAVGRDRRGEEGDGETYAVMTLAEDAFVAL